MKAHFNQLGNFCVKWSPTIDYWMAKTVDDFEFDYTYLKEVNIKEIDRLQWFRDPPKGTVVFPIDPEERSARTLLARGIIARYHEMLATVSGHLLVTSYTQLSLTERKSGRSNVDLDWEFVEPASVPADTDI